MRWHDRFNRTAFARFINSRAGRVFRVAAGVGFVTSGFLFHQYALGVAGLMWGLLPLSAGALDLCYVSAVLGGPLRGKSIRAVTESIWEAADTSRK